MRGSSFRAPAVYYTPGIFPGQTAARKWTRRFWTSSFWSRLARAVGSAEMVASEPRLSVAPMMDWTDVHYRQLARLLTRHTVLYTEMYVDQTILHSTNLDRFLWFPPEQHPIVCQLGGSDPDRLASAARIVESYRYDEINLNCGCPSERVAGAGCFGAALMLQPALVAACCAAMRAAVSIPVTVKCRLGVDDVDSYEALCNFIDTVHRDGGITHFIIHARKCLLKGLSPAENRSIPPLRHSWVFALERDFPHLRFSLNGVVESCHHAAQVLDWRPGDWVPAGGPAGDRPIQGVMIGRAAYNTPWDCLADADRSVFGASANAAVSRRQVLEQYSKYGDAILGRWGRRPDGAVQPGVRSIIIPLLGMFHGQPGARRWRQAVDRELRTATSVSGLLAETMKCIPDHVLDAPPQGPPALPEYSPGSLPNPVSRVIRQPSTVSAPTAPPGHPSSDPLHAASAAAAGAQDVLNPCETPCRTDAPLASSLRLHDKGAAGGGPSSASAERGGARLGERYSGAGVAAVPPPQAAGGWGRAPPAGGPADGALPNCAAPPPPAATWSVAEAPSAGARRGQGEWRAQARGRDVEEGDAGGGRKHGHGQGSSRGDAPGPLDARGGPRGARDGEGRGRDGALREGFEGGSASWAPPGVPHAGEEAAGPRRAALWVWALGAVPRWLDTWLGAGTARGPVRKG